MPRKPRECPVCKEHNPYQDGYNMEELWAESDCVYQLLEYERLRIDPYATLPITQLKEKTTTVAVPLIALMCKKCGYMLFFNAVKLGVVKPD